MTDINTPPLAIHAAGVSRHYGSGKKKVSVLSSIDLSLPRGYVVPLSRLSVECFQQDIRTAGGLGMRQDDAAQGEVPAVSALASCRHSASRGS